MNETDLAPAIDAGEIEKLAQDAVRSLRRWPDNERLQTLLVAQVIGQAVLRALREARVRRMERVEAEP